MGYTTFYEEAVQPKSKIKAKDLFTDCFKKHSRTDIEYALAAGSIYDSADGRTMLAKWNKPWLWFRVFLVLLVPSLGSYAILQIELTVGYYNQSFVWTLLLFSILVTPLTLMVFVWEMNIPRNISIYSLLLYFIIGGLLSLFINFFISFVNDGKPDWYAPIAEEPAKLLATLLLTYLFSRKGKEVYGVTGLVIGAAVGTGFTVFETFQYVYGYLLDVAEILMFQDGRDVSDHILGAALEGAVAVIDGVKTYYYPGMKMVFSRSLPHLNGHLLYCAPYSAAFTLAYHKNKSWREAFTDLTFWGVFVSSCALHALWNSSFNQEGGWITKILITLGSFAVLFFMIRKCLYEVVNEGKYKSGDKAKYEQEHIIPVTPAQSVVKLTGVCKKTDGSMWSLGGSHAEMMTVGRDPACTLCFPIDANGVSRQHCAVSLVNGQYYVKDLNSSCGTFVNGKRLTPQEKISISSSDKVYLGSAHAYIQIG